jgi:5-methylcytosine-specific restriction enzyme B
VTDDGASENAIRILEALRDDRLVLLSGPPATGKTFALNEVARLFASAFGGGGGQTNAGSEVPIQAAGEPPRYLPSPDREKRRVDTFVMNQNSRFAHLWRDFEPDPDHPAGLRVSKGLLWQANQFALEPDSASLVIIEELNRGPAVKVLGPGITGLEADKRSGDDGELLPTTSPIQMMADDGRLGELLISPHLYVVCAQNNADTSVEPIDAAWFRRFARISLAPDPEVLVEVFDVENLDSPLPDSPEGADDVLRATVLAWKKVNERIRVGAGPDYQIGHGVLIRAEEPIPDSVAGALAYVRRAWERVEGHVDEVFFDQIEAIADVLRVSSVADHPYKIERVLFADVERPVLVRSDVVQDDEGLYKLLKTVAEN